MKKSVMSLLLAALLLTLAASPALASESGSQSASQARGSIAVVVVGVELEGYWQAFGYGTGFFVGLSGEAPQYLVTNHHVVADFLELGSGELQELEEEGEIYRFRAQVRVYFSAEDYVEAYVVDSDSVKDIALLRLAQPTDQRTPLPLRSPEESMVGQSVWTVGYPDLAESELVSGVTSWGTTDATVNKGTISRLMTTSGTGVSVIQSDAVIMSGNSGGPMVDENGAVVGVNSFTIVNSNTAERLYYAVNIDEVTPMLRLHDVDYETYQAGAALPLAALIGIAAGAAVIAAVVIVLVLRRKKATAGAALPRETAAVTAGASPAESALRFQGLSGAFAGRRFSIQGTVRIGRDPARNDLVYPAGTQGISGVHCALTLNDGGVTLTDLGSTYGTFLAGGRRLAANESAQLKLGDQFWLGSETQRFVITGKGGV